jgi:hypothetical protein
MSQASVRSIDALRDFRVALALFAEDAMSALGGVDMQVRRTEQWLQHDRRMYWQEQIKRRKEKLSQAQSELHRKKLSEMFGHSGSYSEQKELVKRAEDRLHDAEKRAMMVKKWEPVLQQAIMEYNGQTRRLVDLVGGELPRSLALIDRLIDALDAYTRVAPPSGAAATATLGGLGSPAGDAASAATDAPDEAHVADAPSPEEPTPTAEATAAVPAADDPAPPA